MTVLQPIPVKLFYVINNIDEKSFKCNILTYTKENIVLEHIKNKKIFRLDITSKNLDIKSDRVLIIKNNKNENYVLVFDDKNTRDFVFEKIIPELDIFNKMLLETFFKSETSLLKKNEVCDLIVNKKLIQKIIEDRDKAFLEIMFKYGNNKILYELVNFYDNILKLYENECVYFTEIYEKLKYLSENIFINIIPKERYRYINLLITSETENAIMEMTKEDVESKIKTYEEIMCYIKICRTKGKTINHELIGNFLANKTDYEFSNILLLLSKYFKESLNSFLLKNTSKIIGILEKINVREFNHKTNDLIIHNIIKSLTYLYDHKSDIKTRKIFYEHIHTVFISNHKNIYCEGFRSGAHLKINHFKLYDLLLFMAREHEFMFNEFFINTGMLNHFIISDKDEQQIFFWNRLCEIFKISENVICLNYINKYTK